MVRIDMRIRIFNILILLLFLSQISAQDESKIINGKVSFITSKNIYVKFINTDDINIGDTLNLQKNGIATPCLIVQKKSSTSCVCISIKDCKPIKEDIVSFR